MINEEGLRDWFGKSKSKDGKSGWVNVVTGGTCASDKPGEGTPKCVSSAKRASMSKKERLSAQRRKKAADPGQQSKSGAAKPTYVKTDSPRKMKEETFNEATDKKGKGSGKKDACYHKVKSRYSVWPSAYASGALVKCRKKGAANWGNKSEGMEEFYNLPELTEAQIGALKYAGYEVEVVDEACWKGYEKKGMKTMFGKRYPNCVKKEETENVEELYKGKHGQSEKEYQDSRSDAGKMISGDSKVSGSAYSSRAVASTGPNPAGGSEKPKGQARMGSKDREYLKYRKANLKKEEVTGGILVQDAEDFTPREIESIDIIKNQPIKGGQIQEVVRTKVQTGNMYQVIFGWRGKMMMVKLFFPDVSVPNRQKVANALNKMYPGSQLRSYSHSIVDYDDPYINVGEETIHEEKKKGEKYCRLCEKRETRNKCAYGGKMWDKYSVDDVDDSERGEAASDSGITESDDYNKEVQDRMDSQKRSQQKRQHRKHRYSRFKQNKALPAHQKEGYSNWRQDMQEDMSGMSQKSGDKRSTDSGAGMTAKGVAKYNRRTGGNLKTAVTTPPSKLKPGSKAANRRKSFCARSRGWTGERGKAARRRWNC